MAYALTTDAILRRVEALYGGVEVVSRLPDRTLDRARYADVAARAKRLAVALRRLGIGRGDRVATLCWNHRQHLECYFGIPAAGAVLHTLNLRLHPDELAYVAAHAGDRVVVVDESLLPLLERFRGRTAIEHVLVVEDSYEAALGAADEAEHEPLELAEHEAAALCYTTGTTGSPKGVLYSHRCLVLHSLACALPDVFAVGRDDVVCPAVPMFHANAWGLPYTAAIVGAKLVFPGPHLEPESLLDLFAAEQVTLSAGVPTVWLGVLHAAEAEPDRWDLSSMRGTTIGGAAAPRALIEGYDRLGIAVFHGWGMTELAPVGSVGAGASVDDRVKQGPPLPFVEFRARGADGLVPWDGETMGELEVRGPWVAAGYFASDDGADRWTADGWLRTGDIATIDARGRIEIQDRAKDLVKSGGEWISSVALENALMGHPAVAEAAVVAVPDERWGERPLAAVVRKPGAAVDAGELRAYLEPRFARFWLPERVEFVDEIPRTSAGKFRKAELRERFAAAPPPG